MRQAMYEAKVGDDVFGEDPTVNLLEEMVAKCLGKEAALFVASGTMANLVSLLTHCGRGSEILLGDQSHMFFYEQGGAAALGGIHPRCLGNKPDGTMALSAMEAAIRSDDVHFPNELIRPLFQISIIIISFTMPGRPNSIFSFKIGSPHLYLFYPSSFTIRSKAVHSLTAILKFLIFIR